MRLIQNRPWRFPNFFSCGAEAFRASERVHVFTRPHSGCLVSVRAISPQRYSRSRAGGFGVRRPTPTREAVALPCPPPLRRKRLARLPAAGRRRAEGGAREDAADRRPPRWFRLQRRFPQRGRARHALLTYARRTLRLRGATYPPREACPRSGCPRYNGNNSFQA